MNETKFTPGPWRIAQEPYLHVRSELGCVFANDYAPPANRDLICAAPELYEALERCRTALGQLAQSPVHFYLNLADAALKKARGE